MIGNHLKTLAHRTIIGVIGALTAGSVFAQAQGLLDNRFVMDVGALQIGTSVKGSLNGQSVRNPEINFGEAFGTSGQDVSPRIDALWRINSNHHLRFSTFNHGRSGNKVLERDVQWGDYTFKANGSVDAKLKVSIYELAYEYALLRGPDHEVSASLGVHDMRLSTRLSGMASITGSANAAASRQTQSNAVSVPLPMLGVRAGWVIAPQWYLEGRLQALDVRVNDARGRWSEMRLGATWMFRRNVGLSLAYNRFHTQLDLDKTRFDGNLNFGYQGVQATLTGTF